MKIINKLILFTVTVALTILVTQNSAASGENDNGIITLNSENTIVLSEEVSSESVAKVIHEARRLDQIGRYGRNPAPIYLFLNTPGGSVQAGLELIEALTALHRPVHTITLFAASMGWQIAQSLGERYILANGIMMSHRASGRFQGSFGGQAPSQMDNRYALWLRRVMELDLQTVKRTKGKQTLQSYQKQYSDELWLTGNQSTEQGYSDMVVRARCDNSLNGSYEKKVQFLGFEIGLTLDKCPMNTGPVSSKVSIPTNRGLMSYVDFTNQGGEASAGCLISKENRLCAMDTSVTASKISYVLDRVISDLKGTRTEIVDRF